MNDSITRMEEASFRAWPALETRHYDGWLLRYAEGYTRRANSVSPLYASSLDVREKIATCEAFYASKGLRTAFKMTPAAHPQHLDAVLEEQGYVKEPPNYVCSMDLNDFQGNPLSDLDIVRQVNRGWLGDFCRLSNVEGRYLPTMKDMLESIQGRTAFVRLRVENTVAALGMAVADGDSLGLYDIVVDAAYRQQGLGYKLVSGLLDWGRMQGAQVAYLQVRASNVPALRLYDKIGFHHAYDYWYRVKDQSLISTTPE